MSSLSHIKVLDLSRVLAGPWASQLLADLGAEVIKIENPKGGDDTRHWGPPYLQDRNGRNTAESAYFLCTNRGKKSVCVDIHTEEGQDIIKSLAGECDVLIENFKVGSLSKYGLGYESLSKLNPRLVYCSITGFGQTGPYKGRLGYDFLIQAMGGLMSVTGEPASAGGQPQKVGVALADIMTGLYASNGILAALAERERSGLGQHVDLSLFDVTAATLANQASNYLVGGITPDRLGNSHPNIVPYQSFTVADGHIVITVGNDTQFEGLSTVLGLEELAADERFITNSLRVKNRSELISIIQAALLENSSEYWLNQCEVHGVPAGPINTIDQVMNDPQIKAREMIVTLDHANSDQLEVVGNPIKFSRTPVQYNSAPPTLGEHTESVLERLNLNPAK
jgi:crotonobetainyl-CoA:carnitine CoA-transferase CaiB-like acyl-CoA transferase